MIEVLNKTSKQNAPWFVIPADDKPSARYIVTKILLEELKKYNFKEPSLSAEIKEQIEGFKKQLNNE